jgi:quercetin dioxygenase-like cupin family protein
MARFSFEGVPLRPSVAHGGRGEVLAARVLDRPAAAGLAFVDLVVVPPGASIGLHTHGPDDEEVYVVVEGRGRMTVDGTATEVGPGDVIVNRPGGAHGLENPGAGPMRVVVVDVSMKSPPD